MHKNIENLIINIEKSNVPLEKKYEKIAYFADSLADHARNCARELKYTEGKGDTSDFRDEEFSFCKALSALSIYLDISGYALHGEEDDERESILMTLLENILTDIAEGKDVES